MDEPSGQSRFKQWWGSLVTDQKLAISILTICGASALVFSYIHMRDQINQPFLVSNQVLMNAKTFYDQQNADQNKTELMKTKDTDRDGLNDYAEQYTYGTSPYLGDSDSDGVLDSVEIAQGTNPNCPKGGTCSLVAAQADGVGRSGTSTEAFQDLLDLANGNAGGATLGTLTPSVNLPSINDLQAMASGTKAQGTLLPPGQMTPAMLRDYMLKNGLATTDQLDQLSDAQLLQLYQDAYNQVQERYNSDDQATSPTP